MAYADDDQSLLEAEEDESLPDRDQANLSAGGDAAWKEREAAVLAIGAVAEGCVTGLHSHLSEIVAFLIPLLKDKFPLIRSISCWTLSRFSKYYIVQDSRHQTQALMGLLRHRRILGTNK